MDGRPLQDLTAFQRDLLTLLADLDEPSGRDVEAAIEDAYDAEVTHARIYPNLDALVDAGLVEKQEMDGRENSYVVTEEGADAYLTDLEWRVSAWED